MALEFSFGVKLNLGVAPTLEHGTDPLIVIVIVWRVEACPAVPAYFLVWVIYATFRILLGDKFVIVTGPDTAFGSFRLFCRSHVTQLDELSPLLVV